MRMSGRILSFLTLRYNCILVVQVTSDIKDRERVVCLNED
jgi:hypothetical protein